MFNRCKDNLVKGSEMTGTDLIEMVAGDLLIEFNLFLETAEENPDIYEAMKGYFKGEYTYDELLEFVGGYF